LIRSFDEIYAIAAERHGSREAVEEKLARPLSTSDLAAIPDDRWLSGMARAIFQAGFNWKVIASKWPEFEEAFDGFDISACAYLLPEDHDALTQDKRIVRNPPKIAAVQANAQFIEEVSHEHDSFGAWITNWPHSSYVDLVAELGKRGSRLGGVTAQYFLRSMGVDSFILSKDVIARLNAEGVIDGPATSRKAQRAVQDAFNGWSEESGRSLTEISRVLSLSV
jgi:3-methyladenine DNA glycosylase Tag